MCRGAEAEGDLASGADQNDVRLSAWSVGENVGALRQPICRGVATPVEGRDRLPRQHEDRGLMLQPHDDSPGLDHFVRVGRTNGDETGNGAE